eukprot:TRINITY_DN8251_c0_g1_i1.p1 TRINITY_DN8251_c0_g1~~TRINITY_DN8251_c0_g1_i1.p1  ORF type:complete len:582 (-),score=137.12 TRINITY_DN8251_c0_g1_i1:17-1762(-)
MIFWIFILIVIAVIVLLPKPKDKIEPKNLSFQVPKNKTKITKNKYNSETKFRDDYDAIVIGSGLSGLTCASVLGNYGKRVLVLEQNGTAGGSTHVFRKRDKVTGNSYTWDTGLHYVGEAEKFQKILDFITYQPGSVQFEKLGTEEDGYVYDRIILETPTEDFEHVFRAGRENYLNDLIEKFPEEERAIRNWLDAVETMSSQSRYIVVGQLLPGILSTIWKKIVCRKFFKLYSMTPIEVLNQWTDNKKLIAVLTSQFGDYGSTPDISSFYYHSAVVNHFIEGGYYPIGSAETIGAEIITNIMSRGGEVVVKAPVKQILVENQKAVGVELVSGEKIYAETIISSAGVQNTYNNLLPNPPYKDELPDWKPSTGHIYAFVGLEGSGEELGLPNYNNWILSCDEDYDVVKACNEFYDNPFECDRSLCFVNCPSMKDPLSKQESPNSSTVILLTEGREEWFEEWKDFKKGKRGDDYTALKEIFKERLLRTLYKHYPKCEGRVRICLTATPLTNEHYLSTWKGCSYGLQHTAQVRDWNFTSPETPIEGLYITGQDILCCGIYAALVSGVITSMKLIDYGSVRLLPLIQ